MNFSGKISRKEIRTNGHNCHSICYQNTRPSKISMAVSFFSASLSLPKHHPLISTPQNLPRKRNLRLIGRSSSDSDEVCIHTCSRDYRKMCWRFLNFLFHIRNLMLRIICWMLRFQLGMDFPSAGVRNFLNRSLCSLREMLGFMNWGFSVFGTGKYSDERSPADEWFKQGKIVSSNCK